MVIIIAFTMLFSSSSHHFLSSGRAAAGGWPAEGNFQLKICRVRLFHPVQKTVHWLQNCLHCSQKLAARQHFHVKNIARLKMQYYPILDKGCWFHLCCTQCLLPGSNCCRALRFWYKKNNFATGLSTFLLLHQTAYQPIYASSTSLGL